MANYNSIEDIVAGVENATQLVNTVKYDDNSYITKYIVRDSGKIYTVSDNTLLEITGTLNADLFKSSGTDTIPDGTLLMTLSSPEVLCWTNAEELPTLTATVQGIPVGSHDIISNDIPVGDISISGIATVEADASENATFLLSFDGGAWMIYTDDKWSASDVGMTTAELIAVPSNAWNSMIASSNNMRLKAVLDGVDTVTEVKFNFNNDAKVRTWDYLKSWTWQNVKSRTWGSFKGE